MSRQLDRYLAERATGALMMTAAARSGLGIDEARLTENAIARGELELPNPSARESRSMKEPDMAKKAQVGDGPTNISAAKEVIREVVPKIVNLKAERKALNADIAELRERVNAAGVPKSALDHAIKVREMDPEDRQRFDEGYIIAREAIGVAVQRSLFEMIDTPAGEAANEDEAQTEAAE